ncbi:PP2C family protein-serine/threonine phosphatase [Streptomyces boninensis]|uniref:PP2C family protein-serine/threonine phosphatase n=1 Tax=Streptomyces boninensis TaxID=2039455 RepID=UPI003B20CE68
MLEPSARATHRMSVGRYLPPLALLAVVLLADLVTPSWLELAPLTGAAPVLAAATTGLRFTSAVAGAALSLTVGLDLVHGVWGRPGADVTFISLIAVSLASLLACAIRLRREAELRQVRSVAATAQRVLLRPLPRQIDHLELRGVYLAAESEAQIGGDFYEALHTPYGVRLLIGDVRGKGLDAVGATAGLVGCFREAAYQEKSLADVGRRLEETASRRIGEVYDEEFTERFATALLLELPGDESVVRMVHCGHPEPLILRGGEVVAWAPETPGAPIGLAALVGSEHVVSSREFADGDRLVLYTDGFIEARDRGGRFYALQDEARAAAAAPIEDMAERLRADLLRHAGGRLDDDAALLVIERASSA